MPIYLPRKINYSPPPPSDIAEDPDSDFIQDPDKFRDKLPQPYRMIDKMLTKILDMAWDIIDHRETEKIQDEAKYRPPVQECDETLEIEAGINCLHKTRDENYIACGLFDGIGIVNAITKNIVCMWQNKNYSITSIESALLAPNIYILSTVDELGVARLLIFSKDTIQTVHQFGSDQSSTSVQTQISSCCEYLGVFSKFSEGGSVDIYKIPVDNWKKECEHVFTQSAPQTTQTSEDDGQRSSSPISPKSPRAKFSSGPTLALRVKSPPGLAGIKYSTFSTISKGIDHDEIIATGQNHILSHQNLASRNDAFWVMHEKLKRFDNKDTDMSYIPKPTFHFVKPKMIIWWSGQRNLLVYNLLKTAKDIERKPDSVIPVASAIKESCLSDCSDFLAYATVDGNLTIWDLKYILPIKTINIGDYMTIEHLRWVDDRFRIDCRNGRVWDVGVGEYCDNEIVFESYEVGEAKRTLLLEANSKLSIVVYENREIEIQPIGERSVCKVNFEIDDPYQPLVVYANKTLWMASSAGLAALDMRRYLINVIIVKRIIPDDASNRAEMALVNRVKKQGDRKARMQERWSAIKNDLKTVRKLRDRPRSSITASSLTRTPLFQASQ